MVKMFNANSGNVMWVADNRVEEYRAAGHRLAAPVTEKPAEPEPAEKPEKAPEKPKKAATKKRGA